jgi:outer membrane protein W
LSRKLVHGAFSSTYLRNGTPAGCFSTPCYVGLGVNDTLVYDEDTESPISGAALELDDSFELSTVAGIEFELADRSVCPCSTCSDS